MSFGPLIHGNVTESLRLQRQCRSCKGPLFWIMACSAHGSYVFRTWKHICGPDHFLSVEEEERSLMDIAVAGIEKWLDWYVLAIDSQGAHV